jgi:hypothetical protein
MALPQGYIQTSQQIRIGEATAVTLATSGSSAYPILYADRALEVLEAGIISGKATVQDAAAPATSYIVCGLWNQTDATKIAQATILGQAVATQILPGAYVAIATEVGIDDLGNQAAAAGDTLEIKFDFTNLGATSGIPDPIAHIRYMVTD